MSGASSSGQVGEVRLKVPTGKFFKVLFSGGLVLVQEQKQRHLLRRLQSTCAECVVLFTMLRIEVEI